MLITIVGTKGSQGKSTISHAIAYEKGFGIITNDIDSSVDEFLPEDRVIKLRNDDILPEIPDDTGVVFDGKAGIDEPVVKQAIKNADWVIVPTIYGVEELKRAIRGIKQIEQLNTKILVVANSMKVAEFEEVKGILAGECSYPVLHIRNSKHVAEMLFIPESIEEKFSKGGLTAYSLKDIRLQFQELYQHLGI